MKTNSNQLGDRKSACSNLAAQLRRGGEVFSRGIVLALCLLAVLRTVGTGEAEAALTTLSYSPAPGALSEFGGSHAYTWRLDNLPNGAVTGASITFSNIENAGGNSNRLFAHLLDTARGPGVATFIDNPSPRRPMADLTDDFSSTRHHAAPNWLVAPGTDDTNLFGKSFMGTPESWTYTFTEAEVTKLNQYASDGSIAFGFDSDSLYRHEGVSFNLRFAPGPPGAASPIPEASAVFPLSLILVMAVAQQSRSRRRAMTLAV